MNPSAVLGAQQGSNEQMIRFNHVSKVYDRGMRPALDDVDIKGSGKSPFLRLVIREERPTKGRIHVLGRDLSKISSWKVPQLRQEIGFVFQDFRLLENKTVLENVALASQVIGKPRHYILSAVPEALDLVGLAGKERRLPHELSGGEQQRVAIARAMVNRPTLLLADEPTGTWTPRRRSGSCVCSTASTGRGPRSSWRLTTTRSSTRCVNASSSSRAARSCATRTAVSTARTAEGEEL